MKSPRTARPPPFSKAITQSVTPRTAAKKPLQLHAASVKFDADFECANLEQVRMRDSNWFDLWVRSDTNANGEIQWFFFRMRNKEASTVKITIVNLTKPRALFIKVSSRKLRLLGDAAIVLVAQAVAGSAKRVAPGWSKPRLRDLLIC